MTLKEAIESGHPFRRPFGWATYADYLDQHNQIIYAKTTNAQGGTYLTIEDILACDWEIKQGPRECWIHPNAIDTLKEEGTYTAAISKYQEGRSGWILVREVTE